MNVFKTQTHSPRYYLKHPLAWVKDFSLSLKWARQRVIRGYSDSDRFSICEWFIGVVAPILDDYAANHIGYPGGDDGFTDEEWSKYILEITRHLRNASEAQTEQTNEFEAELVEHHRKRIANAEHHYDDEGWHTIDLPPVSEEQKACFERYINRAMDISKWQQSEIKTALSMIGEHFFAIWG